MSGFKLDASFQTGADGSQKLTRQPFTGGFFSLSFDNAGSSEGTSYLKSVDGGGVKGELISEPVGPHNLQIKHLSTIAIEPITFEIGLAEAKSVLKWIKESWDKQYSRRNGMISYADANCRVHYEHWFYNAVITEVSFPAFDAASKDSAYLKVKIQPENVELKRVGGSNKVAGTAAPRQKEMTAASFSIKLDPNLDMRVVSKIENVSFKQGVKTLYSGRERLAQVEPTKIEFSDFSVTMPMQFADHLFQWHEDFVIKGKRDPDQEKTGAIEVLSPNKGSVLFRIDLYQVGIRNAAIAKSDAHADGIKRVKFDFYVGQMKLDKLA